MFRTAVNAIFFNQKPSNYSSSLASTSTPSGICGAPIPLADPDDEERIGPDNFKNDEIMFPEPDETGDAPVSSSPKSPWTSLSAAGKAGPPLEPPLKLPLDAPKPPALKPANFEEIA